VPTLSVLVLNHNYGHFLEECLDSIVRQTIRDIEVLVIDDVSTDNSVEIVTQYLSDPRVRLIAHDKNLGFAPSLIEGTEVLSSGKYLTVVSADDVVIRDDAFERQVAMLERNPQAAFCFTAFDFLRSTETTTHRSYPEDTVLGPKEAFHEILMCKGVWPQHSGAVLRAESYRAAGGYRRDITLALDLAMWFDLSMVGGFAYLADSCHAWRIHGGQMTSAKARGNIHEMVQVVQQACADGQSRGFGTGRLRRRVLGRFLAAFAINEAFAGHRAEALKRWAFSVRECPLPALASSGLWSALVRATLGERGFAVCRRLAHPLRRPAVALDSARVG
jgi:glycosyl transferase family 2